MSERDFDQLAAAVLEGSASADDYAALEAALDADPAAFDRFIRLAEIHATLGWELQYSRLNAEAHAPSQIDEPAPVQETFPIYRKGYEPQPFKLRAHHIALAAALLLACGLAIYVYSASSLPQSPNPDPASPPPVATLIHNTGDLRTPHGYPAEGDDYGRGEYSLDTGTAEFMLTNAVNVKLRGRTRMVMHNDRNVALSRGLAEFVVPTNARGFTVNLPDGSRVVDLGTRFAIAVNDDGRDEADVTVSQGRVRIERHGQTLELVAGQTARIGSTGTHAITIAESNLIGRVPVTVRPLVEGEFELATAIDVGSPSGFARWGGDMHRLVESDQGVSPHRGDGMLRLMGTQPRGGGKGVAGEIYQLVDIRSLAAHIDSKRVRVTGSARFNRIAGDETTDQQFAYIVYALRAGDGTIPVASGSANADLRIRSFGGRVHTDDNPATWQPVKFSAPLPPKTAWLLVKIAAEENVHDDDTPEPEFPGHYADTVELTLSIAPESPAKSAAR